MSKIKTQLADQEAALLSAAQRGDVKTVRLLLDQEPHSVNCAVSTDVHIKPWSLTSKQPDSHFL